MSDQALPQAGPLLVLPGFMPDAVGFAFRFALALLLAYLISFWIQLSSASSAGVCVAIVIQASPGMALNKAFYRFIGTIAGGLMALVFASAFPQDRIMLLTAFALWLGACTFVGSLLRDFRAYGAVLAGYTVAIIDISGIDDLSGALLSTLDRVAAIVIGILCVAVVNTVFGANTAQANALMHLRQHLEAMRQIALDALSGRMMADDETCARKAAEVLAFRTEATYGSAELPDGRRRNAAMAAVIAALLAMLAASRAIARTLSLPASDGIAPATRAYLDAISSAIREDGPMPIPGQLPPEPLDALLIERAWSLAAEHRTARAGLTAALTGQMDNAPPRVTLGSHNDYVGALLNAIRTMIAVGLGATFCIYAGYPGSTLLLVQQSAITALLGFQPNPSAAAKGFLIGLPVPVLMAALIDYLLLPSASGFVPFAIVVGGSAFLLALAARHPRTANFGPPLLLYLTLLLGPSNTQGFDLITFLNEVVELGLTTVFVMITFRLVLPVSPRRRLFRLTNSTRRSLRHTLRRGRPLDQPALLSRNADRLSQALIWIGSPYPARRAVLSRIYIFCDLDVALRRAWSGMMNSYLAAPELAQAVQIGREALTTAVPEALEHAARVLLAHPRASISPDEVLRGASGLYGVKLLLEREHRALSHYAVLGD
ncbi:FUSC family protein [Rhodopila sp.]|uniref:FUSC family protein n=1 Tax=Rhodopila sp. TaxID=2480087 RepID=UPI003D10A43E